MAIAVPDPGAVAQKWATRTASASGDYTKGIENPKKDWAANTERAGPNYQAAVQAGNIGQKFQYGVRKAGNQKWQQNAKTLGSQRFSAGVQNAAPNMGAGIAPFLSTIAGLTLPDRQPRGNPANYERSRAVGNALNAKRIAMMGAGV